MRQCSAGEGVISLNFFYLLGPQGLDDTGRGSWLSMTKSPLYVPNRRSLSLCGIHGPPNSSSSVWLSHLMLWRYTMRKGCGKPRVEGKNGD